MSLMESHSLIAFVALQIQWAFRKDGASPMSTSRRLYITVDGTDFRIQEPSPFSPTWYSKKFNGPAVRYEIGICIETGWIVWVNGPFKPGEYADESIARVGLHLILDHGERYIADKGYQSTYAITPFDAANQVEKDYMALCRTRHETINRLFKTFKVVGNRFSRSPSKHAVFCHSVINIVQVGIMFGELQPYQILHDMPSFYDVM